MSLLKETRWILICICRPLLNMDSGTTGKGTLDEKTLLSLKIMPVIEHSVPEEARCQCLLRFLQEGSSFLELMQRGAKDFLSFGGRSLYPYVEFWVAAMMPKPMRWEMSKPQGKWILINLRLLVDAHGSLCHKCLVFNTFSVWTSRLFRSMLFNFPVFKSFHAHFCCS